MKTTGRPAIGEAREALVLPAGNIEGRPWSNSLLQWQLSSNRGGDRRTVGSLLPSSGNIAELFLRGRERRRRYVFLLLPTSAANA